MLGKGGEVVTRQPYRKVWLDHLLSKEILYTGNCIWCVWFCESKTAKKPRVSAD